MAKGQRHSNKELRKPKQEKQRTSVADAAAASASPMKIIEAARFSTKTKK